MPGAITVEYDYRDDTGDPEDGALLEDDTSGFMDELLGGGTQLLSSILGGGKGKAGQGIGESIGMMAGAGLGTLAGGAGTGLGAALGKAAGGAVERLVRTSTKKKPPPKKALPAKAPAPHQKRLRILTKRDRKLLVEAEQMSRRTGEPGYLAEAKLRAYRPAEYKRRRDAGLLWSQQFEVEEPRAPESTRYAEFDESPYYNDPNSRYDDTAAPEARPQPRRHISTVPMSCEQMDQLVRVVPMLRNLDPRLLRTMSGSSSVARDVSGVDPTTGIYHALPGETPHGITKKLTGQVERTQELLAANPGKSENATEWNIPPGWLQYARETGAPTFITSRKYTVILNDTPIGIAKKMNAFVDRPQWWSELRAANPHKPTQAGTGNWVSLYPNEEIGIPDAWPETPLAVKVELPLLGNEYEPPGLPAPGKTTTLDPGVVPHAQALLAKWAITHPSDCNPSDYGRNATDLLSGVTPRTTQALSSFQTWWNKRMPTRALNTSGELDNATYQALVEADNASNAPQPSPQQTEPAPNQQQTEPSNTAPTGWPANWPWPFPAPNATQQQQPEQPQQPAPAPTQQQTQPAPSNTAPTGWPANWPWPLPGLTAPQQQPEQPQQPAPAPTPQQSQPAPSNTPPTGWPANWPWPLPGLTAPQQQPEQPQQPAPAPTPQQSQPAPSNTAPTGWPANWPWPFPAPNTTQQQQPAPTPTPQQSQPAPSNGAPPLWPKELPWPPFPNNAASGGQTAPTTREPTPQPMPPPGVLPETPSSSTPPLDNHLTPREREEVLSYLAHGKDADQMDRVAIGFAQEGYPLTAAALHTRANELRASNLDNSPPVVFVYSPEEPLTPTAGEKTGSVLPVLAVLGAGLVLS